MKIIFLLAIIALGVNAQRRSPPPKSSVDLEPSSNRPAGRGRARFTLTKEFEEATDNLKSASEVSDRRTDSPRRRTETHKRLKTNHDGTSGKRPYEVQEHIDDLPNDTPRRFAPKPRVITETRYEAKNAPSAQLFTPSAVVPLETITKKLTTSKPTANKMEDSAEAADTQAVMAMSNMNLMTEKMPQKTSEPSEVPSSSTESDLRRMQARTRAPISHDAPPTTHRPRSRVPPTRRQEEPNTTTRSEGRSARRGARRHHAAVPDALPTQKSRGPSVFSQENQDTTRSRTGRRVASASTHKQTETTPERFTLDLDYTAQKRLSYHHHRTIETTQSSPTENPVPMRRYQDFEANKVANPIAENVVVPTKKSSKVTQKPHQKLSSRYRADTTEPTRPRSTSRDRARSRHSEYKLLSSEENLEVLPLFESEFKTVRHHSAETTARPSRSRQYHDLHASSTTEVKYTVKPARKSDLPQTTPKPARVSRRQTQSTESATAVPSSKRTHPEVTTSRGRKPVVKESVEVSEVQEITSKRKVIRRKKPRKNVVPEPGFVQRVKVDEPKVSVSQIVTSSRGSKKADANKLGAGGKRLTSSEEDIDESDNYPEPFKALIQAKKGKKGSRTNHTNGSEVIAVTKSYHKTDKAFITTHPPAPAVTNPSVMTSTTKMTTTTTAPTTSFVHSFNRVEEYENELDAKIPTTTTHGPAQRPTRRRFSLTTRQPAEEAPKTKRPSPPNDGGGGHHQHHGSYPKATTLQRKAKTARSTVAPATQPAGDDNTSSTSKQKFHAKFNSAAKVEDAHHHHTTASPKGARPGFSPKPSPSRGLYSSKKGAKPSGVDSDRHVHLKQKYASENKVPPPPPQAPSTGVKKPTNRFSSRYRSDILPRVTGSRPTGTPAYVPTVPTVTPPPSTPVRVEENELGMEIISFDDPVNTVPSANLISGDYLSSSTEKNLPTVPSTVVTKQSVSVATGNAMQVVSFAKVPKEGAVVRATTTAQTVPTKTVEKPVSIIEQIINSISAIPTTTPPDKTYALTSGAVEPTRGSAILKITKKPQFVEKTVTKTTPNRRVVSPKQMTTEKSTTVIERILSSLSAIKAETTTDSHSQVGTTNDFDRNHPSRGIPDLYNSKPSVRVTKSTTPFSDTSSSRTYLPAQQHSTSINPLTVLEEISSEQTLQKRTIGKLLALLNALNPTTSTTTPKATTTKLVVVTPKLTSYTSPNTLRLGLKAGSTTVADSTTVSVPETTHLFTSPKPNPLSVNATAPDNLAARIQSTMSAFMQFMSSTLNPMGSTNPTNSPPMKKVTQMAGGGDQGVTKLPVGDVQSVTVQNDKMLSGTTQNVKMRSGTAQGITGDGNSPGITVMPGGTTPSVTVMPGGTTPGVTVMPGSTAQSMTIMPGGTTQGVTVMPGGTMQGVTVMVGGTTQSITLMPDVNAQGITIMSSGAPSDITETPPPPKAATNSYQVPLMSVTTLPSDPMEQTTPAAPPLTSPSNQPPPNPTSSMSMTTVPPTQNPTGSVMTMSSTPLQMVMSTTPQTPTMSITIMNSNPTTQSPTTPQQQMSITTLMSMITGTTNSPEPNPLRIITQPTGKAPTQGVTTTTDPFSSIDTNTIPPETTPPNTVPPTLPTLSNFEVSHGSVKVFSANDLLNVVVNNDDSNNGDSTTVMINMINNRGSNQDAGVITTDSAPFVSSSPAPANTNNNGTTAPPPKDISSNIIDTTGSVSDKPTAQLINQNKTNDQCPCGRINSNVVQEPVRNDLSQSSPPPPPGRDKDYYIFAVLPNNTVLRKRPSMYPTKETPFLITAILPNNTIVRKFPNGTLVPKEPVIRVIGFDTRENPPPLPDITSNQVTPEQAGRPDDNKDLPTAQTVPPVAEPNPLNIGGSNKNTIDGNTTTTTTTTPKPDTTTTTKSSTNNDGTTTPSNNNNSNNNTTQAPLLPTLSELLGGKTIQAFNNLINQSSGSTKEPVVIKTLQVDPMNQNVNNNNNNTPISGQQQPSTMKPPPTTTVVETTQPVTMLPTTQSPTMKPTPPPTTTIKQTTPTKKPTPPPTTTTKTTTTKPTTPPTTTIIVPRPFSTTYRTTTGFPSTTFFPTFFTTLFSTIQPRVRLTTTPISVTTPPTTISTTKDYLTTAQSRVSYTTTPAPATTTGRVINIRPRGSSYYDSFSTTTTPTTYTTTVKRRVPTSNNYETNTIYTTGAPQRRRRPTTTTTVPSTTPLITTLPPPTITTTTPKTGTTITVPNSLKDISLKGKKLTEDQKKDLETLAKLEKEQESILQQLAFLTKLNLGGGGPTKSPSFGPNNLANRIIALAQERDKTTTQAAPTTFNILEALSASNTRESKNVAPSQGKTPSIEDLVKQLNVNNLNSVTPSISIGSTYGKSQDAILASLLKEQGIGPTTPKSLGDQIKLSGVFTQTAAPPTRRTTTQRPPGRLMQGLSWLLNRFAQPPPRPRPRQKPRTKQVDDDELLTKQPTHITPVVDSVPVQTQASNSLSEQDLQALIKQLEAVQKDPKKAQNLDLKALKDLQQNVKKPNYDLDSGVIITPGNNGATSRATGRPARTRGRKSTTSQPATVSNSLINDDDFDLGTTERGKVALPPVRLNPVPGIPDENPRVRGQLINAAVNVTKAISTFLGSAIQDAASQFTSLFANGSGNLRNYFSSSSVFPAGSASSVPAKE